MKFINLLIILLLFFVISCSTGFRSKKLVYSTPQSAFYVLARNQIPGKSQLEGNLKHPYSVTPEKLKDILGNIQYIKTTRINFFQDYIYDERQLDKFCTDLAQTFENLDDKSVAVVISQYDPTRSVISNSKRTSFLTFVNEEGLNFIFGDIQQDVSREKSYNFFDWTQVEPIGLNEYPDENEIILRKDLFIFKKQKGYQNRKWLVFSLDNLAKYKFESRIFDNSSKE